MIRTAAQHSRFVMSYATLFLPEFALSYREPPMLYKSISDCRIAKKLEWDNVEIVEQTQNVLTNTLSNL